HEGAPPVERKAPPLDERQADDRQGAEGASPGQDDPDIDRNHARKKAGSAPGDGGGKHQDDADGGVPLVGGRPRARRTGRAGLAGGVPRPRRPGGAGRAGKGPAPGPVPPPPRRFSSTSRSKSATSAASFAPSQRGHHSSFLRRRNRIFRRPRHFLQPGARSQVS